LSCIEVFLSAAKASVAVLATLDTKGREARFIADALVRAGATPWIVDLSLQPHALAGADVTGAEVSAAAGATWRSLSGRSRQDAAAVVAEGARKAVLLASSFHIHQRRENRRFTGRCRVSASPENAAWESRMAIAFQDLGSADEPAKRTTGRCNTRSTRIADPTRQRR
jgi:Uncharacterised protein family (UPF0261)